MKKRTLCLLLAGTMALSLLSGCGDSKTGGKTADDAAQHASEGVDNPMNGEDDSASGGSDGAFARDPWDELRPGETAVQYYDIFIKSGMTVGEVVEAIESSDVYQAKSISWSDKDLDEEFTVLAPEEISVYASDGYKAVAEDVQSTYGTNLTIQCDGNTIMVAYYFARLPGEEGTTYRLRDLPVFLVTPDTIKKYANFDETRTFIGSIGEIRNMGAEDFDALYATAFKDRDPNLELDVSSSHYRIYNSTSYLPFSWNGYSIWTCQNDGNPVEGFPTYSSFTIDPQKDALNETWILDGRAPTDYCWWAADNAG